MEINIITKYLNEIFNPHLTMDGDFIGFQHNSKNINIKNIYILLDLTLSELELIKEKADLIITHHPLFFGDKNEILKNDRRVKKIYKILKSHDISLFVIHTNADFNINNIALFQLKKIFNVDTYQSIKDNNLIIAESIKLKEYITFEKIKESIFNLNISNSIRFNKNNKIINKIIISSGSNFLNKDKGVNTLHITGELKWHQWVEILDLNLNFIELCHCSEYVFLEMIENILRKEFSQVSVVSIKPKLFEIELHGNK